MENKQNSSQSFIDDVRRIFRPRMNYQAISTPGLIFKVAKEWTTSLEIVVRIIDLPQMEQALALQMARSLTALAHEPERLAVLHARIKRYEPLAFLLFHLFDAEHILAELSRRLSAPLRVGSVLAAVSAPHGLGGEYYEAFLKVLNIDYLQDYSDRIDPRDIRHDGIVGAMERVRKLEVQLRALFPRPRAFVITPEITYLPECRRWDWTEFYREEMARVQAGLCVYFHPEIERLSSSAWGAYHDEFRERDALKRGGPGRKRTGSNRLATNEPANSSKSESNNGQDLDRQPIVHSEFRDEKYGSATETTEQETHSRLFTVRILHVAETKLGDKAKTYFEGLAQGLTQKEAAAAAGISDSMARRYQAKMRLLCKQ
jgi:hypothetical protein